MIIATIIMCGSQKNADYSKAVIEKKARSMGMEYPGEMRVIDKVHENK